MFYKIVTGKGTVELEKAVNGCIEADFVPFGSPFFAENLYCQAMTCAQPDFNIKAPDIDMVTQGYRSDLPKVPKGPIKRCIKISSSAGLCSKCQSTVERRFIFFGQKRCINPECGEFS